MNAAEITDKLGLHSLRQRAWVSNSKNFQPYQHSADNLLVHSIHLRYLWRWFIRRFGVARKFPPKGRASVNLSFRYVNNPTKIGLEFFPRAINLHTHNFSSPISLWCSISYILSLQQSMFMRRKGGICTMNKGSSVILASVLVFTVEILRILFASYGLLPFLRLALQSCVSARHKADGK
jgi:hypothetical protein